MGTQLLKSVGWDWLHSVMRMERAGREYGTWSLSEQSDGIARFVLDIRVSDDDSGVPRRRRSKLRFRCCSEH